MHELPDGFRQIGRTGTVRHGFVACFILFHLFEDTPRPVVVCGQFLQVTFKMFDNLVFGFSQEAETPLVADNSRGGTNGKRAGIPERVEQAGMAAEFFESLPAPGEVIIFFIRRQFHPLAGFPVMCRQCLAHVEGLGADLARMVDAHHADAFRFFSR